ncbi:MAG: NYN domain-containing protein [Deltaproteobacteria bacterium]|nr:NYN domain-containing protein [Deltaproteobacteria bacterium]
MEDAPNLAIFCDFENIAIGARDADYEFDIHLILERLLDKGNIVVKKAYADWDRYKGHKRGLHEASFELIEIPHVSYSGKNSADIRLVVDALDLCYTKAHVNTFVVLSGDSDFSPLVSKLRENAKRVIGLGVRNSTSDLLIDNCDEFIYYDDLVRKKKKGSKRKGKSTKSTPRREAPKEAAPKEAAPKESPKEAPKEGTHGAKGSTQQSRGPSPKAKRPLEASEAELVELREQAVELVLDTVEALFEERDGNLWGSMVKQTLKRKRPSFSETFHGYATFTALLEDAQQQGLLELQKDEKSGGYLIISFGPKA